MSNLIMDEETRKAISAIMNPTIDYLSFAGAHSWYKKVGWKTHLQVVNSTEKFSFGNHHFTPAFAHIKSKYHWNFYSWDREIEKPPRSKSVITDMAPLLTTSEMHSFRDFEELRSKEHEPFSSNYEPFYDSFIATVTRLLEEDNKKIPRGLVKALQKFRKQYTWEQIVRSAYLGPISEDSYAESII